MITYKNRRTGRVVEIAEADELQAELEQVRRQGKPLDEGLIKLEVARRKRLVDKLADSWKWERVDSPRRSRKAKGGQESETG